jgi:hypothetical protein
VWQIDRNDFCQFELSFGQIDFIAKTTQAACLVKNRNKLAKTKT